MTNIKELYKQYEKYIFRYLYHLTMDFHLAEELTQETFFQVITSFHRFRGDAHVTTWLYKIARNVYYTYKRKNPIHLTIDRDDTLYTSSKDEPEVVYEEKENYALLLKIFKEMPENYREVLWLREWQGLTYEEIAVIIERSIPWVKVNIHRGRRELRKLYLEEEGRI